ncbi:MAG: dTDP-glucose 4,6-dehydratase [Planctomycetota bacterium]
MRLIVTGGAGFIGSSFVRLALAEGHAVTVLDALTYCGNLANLDAVKDHAAYRFVKGEIGDKALWPKLLAEPCDAVVNFAAESHVDRSILDASPFVLTNVVGTQVILDALRAVHAAQPQRALRFLQVSTDEVYGSADDGKPFTEQTPLKPNSPYAASKSAADLLVRAYHHTFGLDTVITRCSNNYGPYQFPEKLIPLFTTNLFEGKPVPVYGDGKQIRDWIHCDDHSRGVLAALVRGKSGEVYNLGGGNACENLRITRLLLHYTGRDDTFIRYVQDRPGHDRVYLIDHTKATRELGWSPRVAFDTGLAETVAWYRAHESWWREIKSGAYLTYYERQYGAR